MSENKTPRPPRKRAPSMKPRPQTIDLSATEVFSETEPKPEAAQAEPPPPPPPPEPEAKKAEPKKPQWFYGRLLAAGLGGALFAGLAVWGASELGLLDKRDNGEIQRLEAIEKRLRVLGRTVAVPATDTGLSDRMAGLESSLADIKSSMKALDQRISTAPLSAPQAKIDEATRGTIDALRTQVSDLMRAVGQANDTAARAAQADAARTSRFSALTALEQSFRAGRPYATELASLKRFWPDAPLGALERHAETGLPSADQLAQDLRGALSRTVKTEESITAQLWNNALGLVRISRTEDPSGDGPDAVRARLDKRLETGDLPGALAEWGKLDAETRAATNATAQRAFDRVAAEQALADAHAGLIGAPVPISTEGAKP